MNQSSLSQRWSSIDALDERFAANLRALGTRRPALAELLRTLTPTQAFGVLPQIEGYLLGVRSAAGYHPVANSVSPSVARQVAAQLCPAGTYANPVLVIGEDLGYLWDTLYRLPCTNPAAPGHRAPLYFLIGNLERFWIMLHVQEWSAMLADPRARISIGPDAFGQFRRNLIDEPAVPWPRSSVALDASLLPPGMTLDHALQDASVTLQARFAALKQQIVMNGAGHDLSQITALFKAHSSLLNARALQSAGNAPDPSASHRPLKVLGITSRYTSFLQHSMRDWLAAFQRLGHRTELVIEQTDHEISGPLAIATASASFQPDLVVCIDHYRKEMFGIPDHVPMAMWVQDAMPHLFSPAGGAAQGPLDYCLGFARLKMAQEFGYPADRYMPAVVGLDEDRFAPRRLTHSERDRFGGEVSFVSHASMPAEKIITDETARMNSPEATRLLREVFENLQSVYSAGGAVNEPIAIRRIIEQALVTTSVRVPQETLGQLVDLFYLRVNNALFRHQSLLWLADAGVDLRLWGRGWENHPQLARFARGPADNESQLPLIYQASKINLQITPHGAVHQRLMEGLAAGGFFAIRQTPGDLMERHFQHIWSWCLQAAVESDADLRRLMTSDIRERLEIVAEMLQYDPFGGTGSFVGQLRASDNDGYIRSAGTIWGADYDAVSYGSKDELLGKVHLFLGDEAGREHLAESMRQVVLERFTYTATTKRLIRFIADELTKQSTKKTAA